MRFITPANLISIDTGFGFARNTDAGLGDVRNIDALHVRLYAKRSQHQASASARVGKHVAVTGERMPAGGMPSTLSCFGPTSGRGRQGRRSSWRLAGPKASPASLRIS